jgi:predicted metalloprotease with PDZ domain
MKYIFSLSNPIERFVNIEMEVEGSFNNHQLELQLPSWRPGRYELGNFAKNVKGFSAFDAKGNSIAFCKTSKDRWLLSGINGSLVRIKYSYYANQLDAGACWVDKDQLYINPVHCCFFIPGRENEKCIVKLQVPEHWQVASGMKVTGKHELQAENFDQVADSPFIASQNLQYAKYNLNGIDFNIWLQGECNPDWPKIIKDFEEFTVVQLKMMKEFPAKDFHFLIQVLPTAFYHGVEHLNSTVLAIGPGYNLMKPTLYNDLLGVASHELFHCWNVKTIRPVEMLPYDFTKENYATTGYVYEGVTTYYGDLFLARSGFFNLKEFLDEYSVRLQKHMDNSGRFNYCVAESSFDTWLDGYVPGIPGRKVSIYDEGCLLAWILDFMIRSATDSNKSLDEVMQVLYFDFAKKNKGYSRDDFREVAEMVAGRSFVNFFDEYVYKASSLELLLAEVISLAGLKFETTPAVFLHERILGLKTELRNGNLFVGNTFPGSPSFNSGLVKDDELIALNGIRIENNISDLFEMFDTKIKSINLTISSQKKIQTIELYHSEKHFYNKYSIIAVENVTQAQLHFRQEWLKG